MDWSTEGFINWWHFGEMMETFSKWGLIRGSESLRAGPWELYFAPGPSLFFSLSLPPVCHDVRHFVLPQAPSHGSLPTTHRPRSTGAKWAWTEISETARLNKSATFELFPSGTHDSDQKLTKAGVLNLAPAVGVKNYSLRFLNITRLGFWIQPWLRHSLGFGLLRGVLLFLSLLLFSFLKFSFKA
jgi:hypothetical protein